MSTQPIRSTQHRVSDAEVERRLSLARAALAVAGHEVTDEETRELARRVAAEEMTGDEAVAAIRASMGVTGPTAR